MGTREEEKELEEWIEAVLGETLSPKGDLAASLKSGIVLCRLIETVSPGSLRSNINITSVPLLEMENIGYYLKACWRLGIQTADIFATSDLYLKKNMARVIANLTALARFAAASGKYPGPYHPRFLPAGVSIESNSQISPRHGGGRSRRDGRDAKREKQQLEHTGAEINAELKALEERNAAASAKVAEAKRVEADLKEKLASAKKPPEGAGAESDTVVKQRERDETARVTAMKAELAELRRKDEERARLLAEVAAQQSSLQEKLVGLAKMKEGSRNTNEAMQLHAQLSTQLNALSASLGAPSSPVPVVQVSGADEPNLEVAMAKHLEAEERNARRSVLVQNAAARQRTMATQLTSDKASEEASKKIVVLEAEVAKLKKAGENSQAPEVQLDAVRKAEKERMALAKEAATLQDGLRAKLAEIAKLEKESQRLRDENHRKSIMLREARGGGGAIGGMGVSPDSILFDDPTPAKTTAPAFPSQGIRTDEESVARRAALVKEVMAANARLTAQLAVQADAEQARLVNDRRVFSTDADASLNEELKKLRFVAAKQAKQAREGAVFQEDLFRQILLLQDQLDAGKKAVVEAEERAKVAEERAKKAEDRLRKALASATAASLSVPSSPSPTPSPAPVILAPTAPTPSTQPALSPVVSSKLMYYASMNPSTGMNMNTPASPKSTSPNTSTARGVAIAALAPTPTPATVSTIAPASTSESALASASASGSAAPASSPSSERASTPPRRSPRADKERSPREKKEKKIAAHVDIRRVAPEEKLETKDVALTASTLVIATSAAIAGLTTSTPSLAGAVSPRARKEKKKEEKEKSKSHRSRKDKHGLSAGGSTTATGSELARAREDAEKARAENKSETEAKARADEEAREEAQRKRGAEEAAQALALEAKRKADEEVEERVRLEKEAKRKADEEAAEERNRWAEAEATRERVEEETRIKEEKEKAAVAAATPASASVSSSTSGSSKVHRSKSSRKNKDTNDASPPTQSANPPVSSADPLAGFLTMRQTQARLRTAPSSTNLTGGSALQLSVPKEDDPVRLLSSVLRRLLSSRKVDYTDLLRVDEPLATDEGRRKFVSVLKRALKESASLVLDEESFEMLLHLYHRALEHYEAAAALDVRSLAVLMYTSCAIGRNKPNTTTPEYLCSYVQSYSVWRNMAFWEELFLEELARKRRRAERKSRAIPDQEAMHALLGKAISSFVHDMLLTWRVPRDAAQEFINQQAARHELPVAVWTQLVDDLEAFESLAEKGGQGNPANTTEETAMLQRMRDKYAKAAAASRAANLQNSSSSTGSNNGTRKPGSQKTNSSAAVSHTSVRLTDEEGGVEFGSDPFWIGGSKKWNRRSRQIPKGAVPVPGAALAPIARI